MHREAYEKGAYTSAVELRWLSLPRGGEAASTQRGPECCGSEYRDQSTNVIRIVWNTRKLTILSSSLCGMWWLLIKGKTHGAHATVRRLCSTTATLPSKACLGLFDLASSETYHEASLFLKTSLMDREVIILLYTREQPR